MPKALQAPGLVSPQGGALRGGRSRSHRRVSLEYPIERRRPRRPVPDRPLPRAPGRARPGHGGVPAGPQPLPREPVGARSALDRITALYRLYGAGKPAFAADPAFAVGAGDVLKDVRAILMTPRGHAVDRLGQDEERRALRRLAARWRPSLPAEEPAQPLPRPGRRHRASPRAPRCASGRRTSRASPSPATSRCPEPWRRSRAAVRHPGRQLSSWPTRSGTASTASTPSSSTAAPSPTRRTRRTRGHPHVLDGEGGIVSSTARRRRSASSTRRGASCARWARPGSRSRSDVAVDPFRNTLRGRRGGRGPRLLPAGPAPRHPRRARS